MKIGVIFWLLWIIWAIFGVYSGWTLAGPDRGRYYGGNILLLVLFFLIGWKVFGFVVSE